MISFLPSRYQHRALDGAGAGLAAQYHAVEHECRVDVVQGPAVEGLDGGIEGLGDLAHGAGADPPAEDRRQRDGHLAGAEAEHEAGQDHAVDMGRPPGVGAHHLKRAIGPRARDPELDLAELGHQPAAVAAVAPVGRRARRHLVEVTVDAVGHLALQNILQGRGAAMPVIIAPFDPVALHGLHHPERTG